MKLVVGLGNPGRKYIGTRHNIGFEVLSELSRRFGGDRPKAKFSGEIVETSINNQKTALVWPLTFMNLSGQCVKSVVDFYKLELHDLLVVCDDLNLQTGRIRVRPSGSAGGQNGLKDILNRMGTNQIPRLRVGIGSAPPEWDVKNYVLGKFHGDEFEIMKSTVGRCADAVEIWLKFGIQTVMNQFNADPNTKSKKSNPNELGENKVVEED